MKPLLIWKIRRGECHPNRNFDFGPTLRIDDTRPDVVIKHEYIDAVIKARKATIHAKSSFTAAIDDDFSGNLAKMYENLAKMYENLGINHFYTFDEFFNSDIWSREGG